MFNRDLKEFLMLGNRFFVDPPVSYTTHYNLKKYNDGDDPGAAALNDDKDIIDAKIYSASLTNLTATAPISRSGDNISLQYDTANLKVVANKLTTIQSLNTAASPTFENLTVNDDITMGLNSNDQALLFVSGAIFVRGIGAFLGDFYTSGSIWITADQHVTGSSYVKGNNFLRGNTQQTGSVYVSASLVTRKFVVNPTATSSGYIGSVTASEEDYFQGIGLPPQYDMLVSGSAKFTGQVVVTGSLTVNNVVYAPSIDFGGGNKISQSIDGATMIFTAESSSFTTVETQYLNVAQTASFGSTLKIIPRFATNTFYSDLNFSDNKAKISFNTTSPYTDGVIDITADTINITAPAINFSGSTSGLLDTKTVVYLSVSGNQGTPDGVYGATLLAPATWSISQSNAVYYFDDTSASLQIIIPDADADNLGKVMYVNKPRLVNSANQVEIITPSGQKIAEDTKFYLRSSGDNAHLISVPFVANGEAGYKWRQYTAKQVTRKDIVVAEHGGNFTTVSGAIDYFNKYAVGDSRLTIRPGLYAEAPMVVNNVNGYKLFILGDGSSQTTIYPSSLAKNASSSLFLLSSSCDISRVTLDGTLLTGYGLSSKDDLIRITGSNQYFEFKDIFAYGGYETLCVPVDNSEVYILDAEFGYASSSAIELESNSELDIVDAFFLNNPKSVYVATGSDLNISINTCHFETSPGEVGVFYKSGSITLEEFDILSTTFQGGGTYFSGSTTFVSEEDAKIQIFGNAGLKDNRPFGYLTYLDNTTTMATSPAGTFRKASGSNAVSTPAQKFAITNNRMTFRGRISKECLISLAGTIVADTNNQNVGIAVVKNANSASFLLAETNVRCATATQPYNFASQGILTLSQSDYVEVWITNRSSAANVIYINDMQFITREI